MKDKVQNFTDLNVWQEGHKTVLKIYKITQTFPKYELYGITSQIRRASVSITSNIAEGFSRYHYKEKIHFYFNTRGSISEVQNLLLIAKDIGYIDKKICYELSIDLVAIEKMLNGLIRSTEKQIDSN